MDRRQSLHLALGAVLAAPLAPFALAQDYPNRPIKIISPYAAGGGNDAIARVLADQLGSILGQRVIVDNRPGGNTIIGNELAAKSPADGYTLILNGNGFTTNPAFYAKIAYNTEKDFIPIAFVGFTQLALVVHPALPISTVKEFINLAKSRPAGMNFGNSGRGGPDHLAAIEFNQRAGTDIMSVSYKGSSLAITDLVGGQIQAMITPLGAALPFIETGKLKLLAFATQTRSPKFPNVPTISDAGLPGYEAFIWYGLMAPAGTPEPVVRRLNAEINGILKRSAVQEKLISYGLLPADEALYRTPEEFGAFVKSDLERVAKIARAANITPE